MGDSEALSRDADLDINDVVGLYVFGGWDLSTEQRAVFAKSPNPKAAMSRISTYIIKTNNPGVVERYHEVCEIADSSTDYDSYGPIKATGGGDGVAGRNKARPQSGRNYRDYS